MTVSLDLDEVADQIDLGYVAVQEHPDATLAPGGLFIANYTHACQRDGAWTPLTLACRGLIFDGEGTVYYRPFEKFFNLSEWGHAELPDEPFEVTEKLDGSLGVIYWAGSQWAVATRGSFLSPQALKATELLAHYVDVENPAAFARDRTYCVEIVYPENRIVVDYADNEGLVLLAILDLETGQDLSVAEPRFPHVRTYAHDLSRAMSFEKRVLALVPHDNFEGFVLRFKPSCVRVKLKTEDYTRAHRIVTGLTTERIWEQLRDGIDAEAQFRQLPDSIANKVRAARDELIYQYKRAHDEAWRAYHWLTTEGIAISREHHEREYRKQFAEHVQRYTESLRPVLFALLDDRQDKATRALWQAVRPEESRRFWGDVNDTTIEEPYVDDDA